MTFLTRHALGIRERKVINQRRDQTASMWNKEQLGELRVDR